MNNFYFSFLITLLSGMSTMLGALIIFIKRENKQKLINFSLIFASSIMLFISIFDLIPTSYLYLNKIYDLIPSFLILFIYSLFGSLLVKTISNNNKSNNLYKLGIISMIALVIHNIPEGIVTFISSNKDLSIGIPLSFSIALHNIPEGISIAIPIYYSQNSSKKALKYTLIAALSEPLGALLAFFFLNNINDYLFGIILSFTAGIMIYLSLFELLKEGIKESKLKDILIYFFCGIIIMIISKLII